MSSSTSTSTTSAAYENPADVPTAAPRNDPPCVSGGVDHVPLTVIVPASRRASVTTSRYPSSRSVPTTRQRSPSHSMSSGLTSSRLAAAATSTRFISSAARIAALPTMNETRELYEPLSFGVTTLSFANTVSRDIGRCSTSATACEISVELPCPMSDAPVSTVMPPSKSSLRLITACGSPVQCTGFADPDT